MSLYHKYRPKDFNEIVGNEQTVAYFKSLEEDNEPFPHALLLHGQTGCGKTTVARIVARKLDCNLDFDFVEMNAADFRGIDMVRDLIKSSRYMPVKGSSRVWLIDECHELTSNAQNAFLKLLEDPPQHAYFILCTTDPQKLIGTVRGRCQDLQMNPLTEKEMRKLLRSVVEAEGDELSKEVYSLIIDNANGFPRNALQLLERVLAVGEEHRERIVLETVKEQAQSAELCKVLLTPGVSWNKVRGILNELKGQDAEGIRRHVLGWAQGVLLKGENDKAAQVIEEFWEPFYNVGYPGLVYACYSIVKG